MNADSIARIRGSFNLLAPHAEALMDDFYQRLFTSYPQVLPLFPADMTGQKKHLLAAISLVVKNADRLDTLEKPLMEMGARHVVYGAAPEHYPLVRDTLLASMKSLAGKAWTAEVESAWAAAINAVATVMIRGASNTKRAA